MIQIDKGTWDALISTAKSKKVYISGNILRLVDDEGSPAYKEYIEKAQAKDGYRLK